MLIMAKLNAYDYDFFYDQYFNLCKSTNDIALELKVAGSSVVRKMRNLGIELRKMIKVNCANCGKEVDRKKSVIFGENKLTNAYCSRECYRIHQSQTLVGENNPFYGKKHTDKTRRIISRVNKNKVMTLESRKKISFSISGDKNWNWKGGQPNRNSNDRLKFEYGEWRRTVFRRDSFTCRRCNIRGGILHVHHLKNYSDHKELRFIPINGMTLCESCHLEFHEIYTRKNNTVKQILEFLGR